MAHEDLLAMLSGQERKPSRNMQLALFLRMLADLMDEDRATIASEEPPQEVLTRPHFMPSGG